MAEWRSRVLALVVAATTVGGPAVAGAQDGASDEPFTAAEYLAMWDDAVLPGLAPAAPVALELFVAITGDTGMDARIRELAMARGYEAQPTSTVPLVPVDGRLLQAPAAEAWLALKAAARDAGVDLALTSAHRDVGEQQALFLGRLGGRSEAGIEAALRVSAPPGYSRHHSGYTIDVGQPGSSRGGFGSTRAYAWLAADDFAAARSFGWIPSYPEGGVDMGPDPEAWELVWVGPGRIACARAVEHPSGFCDVAGSAHAGAITWLADQGVTVGCRPGRFCIDDPITRGDAASLLWRLHGAPSATAVAPFADVFPSDPFAPAVDWLWSAGVGAGMTPTSWGPDEALAADDALALLLRLATADDLPPATGIAASAPAPATERSAELGTFISRGEFASILVAYAAG